MPAACDPPSITPLPLWIDAPYVDIRRTVEPATWVWSGIGIASQPAPASGEQNRHTDHGQHEFGHQPSGKSRPPISQFPSSIN
jgi:hypothetical protein